MSQWVLPGSDLINAIRIGNMISQTAVFKSGCSSSKFLSNKSISHNIKSILLQFIRYIHFSRAIACADPEFRPVGVGVMLFVSCFVMLSCASVY